MKGTEGREGKQQKNGLLVRGRRRHLDKMIFILSLLLMSIIFSQNKQYPSLPLGYSIRPDQLLPRWNGKITKGTRIRQFYPIQRITTDPADDIQPAWSPDGRTIVFVSNRINKRDGHDLYAINADGTNERLLAKFIVTDPWGGRFGCPNWLGNTGDIILMDYKFYWEIMRFRLSEAIRDNVLPVERAVWDGDSPYITRLIFVPPGYNPYKSPATISPISSPDGSKIAFHYDSYREGKWVVRIYENSLNGYIGSIDDVGRTVFSVSSDGAIGADFKPMAFSPDGQKLVISACETGWAQGKRRDLYVVDITSGMRYMLTNTGSQGVDHGYVSWSSQNWIAFAMRQSDESSYDLYIIRPDGTGLTRLTDTPWNEIDPSWSPDGTKLVFASDKEGNYDLYVMEIFTSNRPPSVPVLLSPANNATVSPTPTFKVKSEDPDGDQVKFEIEVVKGSETKRFETGFFASGSEATFTVPENQSLSEGQWSWRARAIDSKGAASDWSSAWTFTVQVQVAKPDLVPKDLTLSASEVEAGGKVTVRFKVVNQGQAKANPSKTNVRLSPSPDRPTKDDPLLVSFDTPALDPNQSVTHEAEVTIPAETKAGDYYVWVIVDVDSTAGQSDESNDRIKAPLKVKEVVTTGVINVTVYDVSVDLNTGVINKKPLSGVTVNLLKGNQQISSKTTGSDGKVRFEGLAAGDYTVRATYRDDQTGIYFLTGESTDLASGESVFINLFMGVSIVRGIWEAKSALERLKITLYGFSIDFPLGHGYKTEQIEEAVALLAGDIANAQQALESLQRLLLALELSNRFLRDAEGLSGQVAGAIMDVVAVAFSSLDLLNKVREAIRALGSSAAGYLLDGLFNLAQGFLLNATFGSLKYAFLLLKQDKLASFCDLMKEIIWNKAEKGEAFRWDEPLFDSLIKEVASKPAGSVLLSSSYVLVTQDDINKAAGWAKGKQISGSWQQAYSLVLGGADSVYNRNHRKNQEVIWEAEDLRRMANLISRYQPVHLHPEQHNRMADILGIGAQVVPDIGALKSVLYALMGLLKGISVYRNAKAAVISYKQLTQLANIELPWGIYYAFNPNKTSASKIHKQGWRSGVITRQRQVIDDATQNYLTALNQLRDAVEKDDWEKILQQVAVLQEAERVLWRSWDRALTVISTGTELGETDLEQHPVTQAIEQTADSAAERIELYTAILAYLIERGERGRANRSTMDELMQKIEEAKQSVQQTQQTIQQVFQTLPPTPLPAILNITDIVMPEKMKMGQPSNVRVVIVNDGGSDASNIKLEIHLNGGHTDQPIQEIPSIPAGGSAEIVWSVTPQDAVISALIIVQSEGAIGDSESVAAKVMQQVTATVPSGLAMISFPFIPEEPNPAKLLNIPADQLKMARWNPEKGDYDYYTPESANLFSIVAGKAYWVKLPETKQVSTYGEVTNRARIALLPGWNMIGLPINEPVQWRLNQITVIGPNGAESLEEAEEAGWVISYAWSYEPGQGYRLVYDETVIPGVIGRLEPGKGYWIWAKVPCVLDLSTGTKMRARRSKEAFNGWHCVLKVQADGSVGEAVIGITNGTRGLAVGLPPEPPTGNNGVQVILLKNNTPLAVDVRSDGSRRQEWEVLVRFGTRDGGRGTSERKEVVLTFDGIGYAPKDVSAWLVDTVTGKRLYLRTQPSYRFVAQEGEVERKFKVVVERGNDRPLRVVGLKATPMRGQGVVIEFSLTKPAKVEAEVLTLTGRRVAILDAGSSEGLAHRLVWRGVGIEGQKVGSGVYLVRVRAIDEEGREVQAATVVRLR
jgi:Tol biopolymer transport system component